MEKRTPHHDLNAIKALFASGGGRVAQTAIRDAAAIFYSLKDIYEVISELSPSDFKKSATATNPPNSKIWHDTYNFKDIEITLFIKFAGESITDLRLTSFKER